MRRIILVLLLCMGSLKQSYSSDSTTLSKPRLYIAAGAQASVLIGGMAWLNYVWYNGHEK